MMNPTMSGPDRVRVAYALYESGHAPSFSTDLADNLIAGYGDLDNGFKFELILNDGHIMPYAEIKAALIHSDMRTYKKIDIEFESMFGLPHGCFVSYRGTDYRVYVDQHGAYRFMNEETHKPLMLPNWSEQGQMEEWRAAIKENSVIRV